MLVESELPNWRKRWKTSQTCATLDVMSNENSEKTGEQLQTLRCEIDDVDSQIATLLSRRHQIVIEIGKLKHATGVQVYDDARERFVLERVAAKGHDAKGAKFIRDIYEHIMAGSRAVQADDSEG